MNTPLDDEIRERAPHVDFDWASDFVIELRLRGVSGVQIGAALLEVEAHMAEHGGSAAEAFGPAKPYAASLELPDSQRWTVGETIRLCFVTALAVIGAALLVAGVMALFGDGVAAVNLSSMLVLVVGSMIATVVLVARSEAILRWAVERTVVAAVVMGGIMAGVIVLAVLIPGATVEPPAGVALLLGAVLLLPLIVTTLLRVRGPAADADEIRFPLQ